MVFLIYFNQTIKLLQLMGALTTACCDENRPYTNQLTTLSPQKTLSKTASVETKRGTYDSTNLSSAQSLPNTSPYKYCEPDTPLQPEMATDGTSEAKKGLCLSDFQILGELGSGNFGKVYQTTLKFCGQEQRNELFALKTISRDQFKNKKIQENIKLQKEILTSIKHPFLIDLKYSFADQENVYFVMECATGGSVESLLGLKKFQNSKQRLRVQQFKKLGQKGVQFIAGCAVLGMEALHANNVMYRDLKPENSLIFSDGYVKLADFGLAKILKEQSRANTQAGTISYFAPEMVLKSGYTKLVDFWTLGVFIYELATSESPFRPQQILTRATFKSKVQTAEKHRDWKQFVLSNNLKDLINKLLKFNPQERLGAQGFDQIKSHEFFKSLDWDALSRKQLVSPLLSIINATPIKASSLKTSSKLLYKSLSLNSISDDVEWHYDHKIINPVNPKSHNFIII